MFGGLPASIISGTASQICIQFAGTGATALVAPSALQVCKDTFAPGDKVKRVMLSGVEEDATVIDVDSSTHVTIRLDHGTCATYSSDIRRLRHAKSHKSASRAAETSTAADVMKPKAVDQEAVDILELKRKLDAKLYAAPVAQVNVNAHAAPGAPMFAKFAQTARQLSGTHALDVLLHGSAEHNVESILQNSLSVTHSKHGSKFWMTSDWSTANGYMHGAKRVVAFAALLPKNNQYDCTASGSGHIYVLTDTAHFLPLFEVKVA